MTAPAPWWRAIFSTRMALCIATGFASGMPLYVLTQLLPAWLRSEGVAIEKVGLLALVMVPYTWKFVWAPVLDGLPVLGANVGRRRGWALVSQVVLLLALGAFAFLDPTSDLKWIAVVALVVAGASATQDIALDAYRRELLPDAELGLGNSFFVNAYRLSSLVPGSLALILAGYLPWSTVHLVVAAFVLPMLVVTLWMPEPKVALAPRTVRRAVTEPFLEFFRRKGLGQALLLLAFMLFYKLGDTVATSLTTAFYLDLGFTTGQIGSVAKVAALWSSIVGGLLGGVLMLRIGVHRALWVFGLVQLLSILGYAAIALVGPDLTWLFAVQSFEYLGVGLGTAAFVAFIAQSTHPEHTATQLALLTSLTGLPRTFASAGAGYVVAAIGYPSFFLLCTALALPGLLLLPLVAPWGPDPQPEPTPELL